MPADRFPDAIEVAVDTYDGCAFLGQSNRRGPRPRS
jgi:hypothetical protein